MVEQVEKLGSELNLQPLVEKIVVFEDRKIEVVEARGTQGIAPDVAQLARRRGCETVYVDV